MGAFIVLIPYMPHTQCTWTSSPPPLWSQSPPTFSPFQTVCCGFHHTVFLCIYLAHFNPLPPDYLSSCTFFLYWDLNSDPTPWATPPALFCEGFFRDRFSWTISPGWPQTSILLISASWIAVITGMSHGCLALPFAFGCSQSSPFHIHVPPSSSVYVSVPQMTENLCYLAFWASLTSLNMLICSSIYFPENDTISFFFMAE
jgi:hypothetical protein